MVLLVQCTCRLCWSSVIFVSFTQTRFPLCKMGRRKSKRKPPPKKKMTGDLETQFTCPFCNHEKSCDVKMYSAHLNTPGLWFVGRFLRWLVVSDASSRFVFQQGEKQKHWDNVQSAWRSSRPPLPVSLLSFGWQLSFSYSSKANIRQSSFLLFYYLCTFK